MPAPLNKLISKTSSGMVIHILLHLLPGKPNERPWFNSFFGEMCWFVGRLPPPRKVHDIPLNAGTFHLQQAEGKKIFSDFPSGTTMIHLNLRSIFFSPLMVKVTGVPDGDNFSFW